MVHVGCMGAAGQRRGRRTSLTLATTKLAPAHCPPSAPSSSTQIAGPFQMQNLINFLATRLVRSLYFALEFTLAPLEDKVGHSGDAPPVGAGDTRECDRCCSCLARAVLVMSRRQQLTLQRACGGGSRADPVCQPASSPPPPPPRLPLERRLRAWSMRVVCPGTNQPADPSCPAAAPPSLQAMWREILDVRWQSMVGDYNGFLYGNKVSHPVTVGNPIAGLLRHQATSAGGFPGAPHVRRLLQPCDQL